MKCCGNDLEVRYNHWPTYYVCAVKCKLCGKESAVAVICNVNMTLHQHREIGRLTLEGRIKTGLNDSVYYLTLG